MIAPTSAEISAVAAIASGAVDEPSRELACDTTGSSVALNDVRLASIQPARSTASGGGASLTGCNPVYDDDELLRALAARRQVTGQIGAPRRAGDPAGQ